MKEKVLILSYSLVLTPFLSREAFMNCFESDIRRAVCSVGFAIGLIAQIIILFAFKDTSILYTISVPLVCTLPFSCGFLDEYKNGYVKFSLSRSSYPAYIISKFMAAGISGGILEVLAFWVYMRFKSGAEQPQTNYILIFLSAMLWASAAILFAAVSKSRYLAYGGSFVIYYFMIILYERYWKTLYCLNPTEWYNPSHAWIFGDTGIILLLGSIILILFLIYYQVIRGLLANA